LRVHKGGKKKLEEKRGGKLVRSGFASIHEKEGTKDLGGSRRSAWEFLGDPTARARDRHLLYRNGDEIVTCDAFSNRRRTKKTRDVQPGKYARRCDVPDGSQETKFCSQSSDGTIRSKYRVILYYGALNCHAL